MFSWVIWYCDAFMSSFVLFIIGFCVLIVLFKFLVVLFNSSFSKELFFTWIMVVDVPLYFFVIMSFSLSDFDALNFVSLFSFKLLSIPLNSELSLLWVIVSLVTSLFI